MKATLSIKTSAICVVMLLLRLPASCQVITLANCVDIFKKDTTYLRKLPLKKLLPLDTTMVNGDMYSKLLKAKGSTDVSLMKMVSKDSIANQLIYSFENTKQYDLLLANLKTKAYTLINSSDQAVGAMQIRTDLYQQQNLLITLLKVANKSLKLNKYTLMIKAVADPSNPLKQ